MRVPADGTQVFGRLPWFAPPFLRSRRLRARRDMVSSSRVSDCLPRVSHVGDGVRQGKGGTACPRCAISLEEHTRPAGDDVEHLHRVAGDWQLLADLSFADLLLWVPRRRGGRGHRCLCVAQARPTTAPTAYQDDQSSARIPRGPEARTCGERSPSGGSAARATRVWHLRRAGPARGDPGPAAAHAEVIAVLGPRHQPGDAASAEPAGDRLPRQRRRPLPDDRGRHLPAARIRRRGGQQPARRRRPDPARRARPRRLRQPERPVGLPPAGPRRRSDRAVAGRR